MSLASQRSTQGGDPTPPPPEGPPHFEQSERAKRRAAAWAWTKRIARALLFVAGITAVVFLVRESGPERLLATLLEAAPFLPLVLLLEIAFMSMDVVALRNLLGERGRRVPLAVWVRTGLLQYGVMQLLPAGRTGGEVARAAALAPYVGGARALAMAARLQAATLLGNTAISLPCWLAVVFASSVHAPLAWAVLINGLITAAIGGGIVLASRTARLGGWLGARIAALASSGPSFDAALQEGTPWGPAVLAATIGRVFQTVQYGIILLAVGGSLTFVSALVSQAIHLVGAGLGDMVPNQMGITETAYALFTPFAPSLGLEGQTARAIGIAIIARITQYVLAGIGLLASAFWRPAPPEHSEPEQITSESALPS